MASKGTTSGECHCSSVGQAGKGEALASSLWINTSSRTRVWKNMDKMPARFPELQALRTDQHSKDYNEELDRKIGLAVWLTSTSQPT